MSFNVLAIRTGSDAGDGALYPVLTDLSEPGLIALDEHDGSDVKSFVATAVKVIQVAETPKTLFRLGDVRIDVLVTESRLALACEKYDKGGGWVGFGAGGLLIAVTANAVSKARAAKRSRGKVLVGHLRYPWVTAVGAAAKSGFLTDEAIRIEFREKVQGVTVRKQLELTLPRGMTATLIAQDVAKRVGSYRLADGDALAPDARAAFTALSQGPALLTPAPRTFAFYQMPTFFYANAATAFPRKAGDNARQAAVTGAGAAGADVALMATASAQVQSAESASAEAAPEAPAPALTGAEPAVLSAARTGTGNTALAGPAPVFCSRCGTRNVVGNNFCKACGSPLKRAQGN